MFLYDLLWFHYYTNINYSTSLNHTTYYLICHIIIFFNYKVWKGIEIVRFLKRSLILRIDKYIAIKIKIKYSTLESFVSFFINQI